MRTLRLTLEYDGRAYAGWQVQPNGTGIQQVVEEALERLTGVRLRVTSSGRTDAGVHALGMVAHLETDSGLPLRAFRDGLNRYLPADIAVREAVEVPAGFHARRDALGKWYRYTLRIAPTRSPLREPYVWQIRPPLDLERMAVAAAGFVGTHDFAAFRTSGCAAHTTVRTIFSCTLRAAGEEVHLDVTGDGFLRNMVRRMVGSLVSVGKGLHDPGWLNSQLEAGSAGCGGATAPAQGLCLMAVWYPGEEPPQAVRPPSLQG